MAYSIYLDNVKRCRKIFLLYIAAFVGIAVGGVTLFALWGRTGFLPIFGFVLSVLLALCGVAAAVYATVLYIFTRRQPIGECDDSTFFDLTGKTDVVIDFKTLKEFTVTVTVPKKMLAEGLSKVQRNVLPLDLFGVVKIRAYKGFTFEYPITRAPALAEFVLPELGYYGKRGRVELLLPDGSIAEYDFYYTQLRIKEPDVSWEEMEWEPPEIVEEVAAEIITESFSSEEDEEQSLAEETTAVEEEQTNDSVESDAEASVVEAENQDSSQSAPVQEEASDMPSDSVDEEPEMEKGVDTGDSVVEEKAAPSEQKQQSKATKKTSESDKPKATRKRKKTEE
ncbi:MAG: hypothetical protein IJF71_03305 [Clostridia bacterium]|nr:hypothetical protein [Clostridia bacterium]